MMVRIAAGERVADLCREFGVSRKTVNKFKARFKLHGEIGLEDRSRAPRVIPHRTPPEVMALALEERRKHQTWGPRKLKAVLEKRHGGKMPSHSAIGRALTRAGLVTSSPRRSRRHAQPTSLRPAGAPNDVWCIDYKGQFRLGDRTLCYPLTITDQRSRFIVACEAMASICDADARDVCIEVFREWGLPHTIRSDNGVPFASTGLGGLTQLSALFVRLGIKLERIRPAHPEENGQHERMHRTLKAETTRPARSHLLLQQERFDDWVHEFNHERPHEALDMKSPAEIFVPSTQPMPATLPELRYPLHDDVVRVSSTGSIYIATVGALNLTPALAGQDVGIREELDGRWLISFAHLDLGHARKGSRAIVPILPTL